MKYARMAFLSILVLSVLASQAIARTWHVERDGSGDYVAIQDAVDVAAAGDTIRIGPGRYNEGQVYTFPNWSAYIRIFIRTPDLTLIGSGLTTIVGQSEIWSPEQGDHHGLAAGNYVGDPGYLAVSNIKFENNGTGVYAENTRVIVTECDFLSNCTSCAFWHGPSVTIQNCRFSRIPRDGTHVICWGQDTVRIESSRFVLDAIPPGSQNHLGLEGVQDGLIADCEFRDAVAAVSVSSGSRCTIRACTFDGQISAALYAAGSLLHVDDTSFRNLGAVLYSGDSDVEFRGCQVENVERCSFGPSIVDRFVVNDCDLARGREGVVVVYEGLIGCEPRHLDFSNNYWGTDNPDSIRAWIHDANDSDRSCYFIDYEPFRSESMAAERKSLGDVKALFR